MARKPLGEPMVVCPYCQAAMHKAKTTLETGILKRFFQAVIIFVGVCLCLTVAGAVIGVPLVAYTLWDSTRKVPVWQCGECDRSIPRK
jgi:hypothetical protein